MPLTAPVAYYSPRTQMWIESRLEEIYMKITKKNRTAKSARKIEGFPRFQQSSVKGESPSGEKTNGAERTPMGSVIKQSKNQKVIKDTALCSQCMMGYSTGCGIMSLLYRHTLYFLNKTQEMLLVSPLELHGPIQSSQSVNGHINQNHFVGH